MPKWNSSVVLALWLLGLAGVRFYLVLQQDTFIGIDGGAYLQDVLRYWMPGYALGGNEVHFERPPLAPGYILVPFLWLFGVTPLAYNLYAAFGSMLLFPGYYLLARRMLGPTWAVLAVMAASLDWQQWIMFVTGVVPVLGFGTICLALWAMLGSAAENRLYHRLVLLFAIPLIALSNQTSAGIALVSLSMAWLVLPHKIRLGRWLALAGLLALGVAWPWYKDVLPGGDQVSYPGRLLYLAPWYLFVWWQTPVLLTGVAFAWYASKRLKKAHCTTIQGLHVLCAVVATHALLSLVNSNDETLMNVLFRSGIWVMIPFWILAIWLFHYTVTKWHISQMVRTAIIGSVTVLAAWGASWDYNTQYLYSTYYSEDVKAAVESLNLSTVARIGTNAESRGFWLAALTGKPVVWIQPALPSPRYVEEEHQARCELGWLPDCADGYVSHWIIDKTIRVTRQQIITRAPDPINTWEGIGRFAPWLRLTWAQGNVEVWEYQTEGVSGLPIPTTSTK